MDKNMNYDLFDEKMFEVNFNELSKEQQNLFDSEEEFHAMKICFENFTNTLKAEKELAPSEGIELRLLNTMDTRSTGKNEVHKSSFADLFLQVFSLQNIGIKLAMASVLLVCSFWFNSPKMNNGSVITADSTYHFADTATNTFDDSITAPIILFIQ